MPQLIWFPFPLEEYVNGIVREMMEEPVERAVDAMKKDTEAAERRVAELEFEKLVRQNAVLGGVLPRAVDFIVNDVAKLFEVRESRWWSTTVKPIRVIR